jgi:AraC-like DNA-binding protein
MSSGSSTSAREEIFAPRSATLVRGRPSWAAHPPHPAIAGHVSTYWTVDLRGRSHTIRTLPDACVDLTLDLSGRVVRAYVAGGQDRARTFTPRGDVRLMGARLYPGSAPLLGIRVAELADEWIPLERYLGAEPVRQLTGAVRRAAGRTGRLGVLDAFLVERFAGRAIDPLLARALGAVFASEGTIPVADLAAAVATGPRTLTRLFHRWIGLPPKRLARIVRFQAALRRLPAADSWAALAADTGYFDQAHFIRELRDLYGATPTAAAALAARTR